MASVTTERATPTKVTFTKRLLTALEPPEGNRQYLYDDKTPGLALCITPTGKKTFYLYRKVDGRPVRYRLGAFPDISVEQARKMAARWTGKIADGENPQALRTASRGEMTLGELFAYYLDKYAKARKKTWKEDDNQFKRYLDGWKNRKLSSITNENVRTLHNRIGKDHGIYAANRLLSLLCKMFNLAIDDGKWSKPNPTRGIKKFREKSRERYMQADELPRFFAALEAEPNRMIQDFFLLVLFTGARRSNVLAMRWEQLHLERATWEIPETKSGDGLTVHLPIEAVRILQERQLVADGSPWVFPSRSGTRTGHFANPQKAWERIVERAGIDGLRIHDLRRTLGSWQAATGASLPIIGKSLGHKQASTTQIYARLNIDPVRASVDLATAAMLAAVEAARQQEQGGDNAE